MRSRRPEETGWQDTVHVDPGTMASIAATLCSGLYVWHCHILSHEDNEMMRPFVVEDAALKRRSWSLGRCRPIGRRCGIMSGLPRLTTGSYELTAELRD